jgi:hypothetical protein
METGLHFQRCNHHRQIKNGAAMVSHGSRPARFLSLGRRQRQPGGNQEPTESANGKPNVQPQNGWRLRVVYGAVNAQVIGMDGGEADNHGPKEGKCSDIEGSEMGSVCDSVNAQETDRGGLRRSYI